MFESIHLSINDERSAFSSPQSDVGLVAFGKWPFSGINRQVFLKTLAFIQVKEVDCCSKGKTQMERFAQLNLELMSKMHVTLLSRVLMCL